MFMSETRNCRVQFSLIKLCKNNGGLGVNTLKSMYNTYSVYVTGQSCTVAYC